MLRAHCLESPRHATRLHHTSELLSVGLAFGMKEDDLETTSRQASPQWHGAGHRSLLLPLVVAMEVEPGLEVAPGGRSRMCVPLQGRAFLLYSFYS